MNEDPLSVERFYTETNNNIRATDDISFKLIGIVPLVSGATLLTFFLKESIAPNRAPLVVALALFAALITLGLFRWELRNIQNCSWLKRRVEVIEDEVVTTSGALKQPEAPHKIGKTEAEKGIYSVTILAWLSIPYLVSPFDRLSLLLVVYVAAAVLIATLTVLSARADVHVPKKNFVEQKVPYIIEQQGEVCIITNVPVRVCQETGERQFDLETLTRLQQMQQSIWAQRTHARVIETSIFDFGL
jgi:YgiT-type zinc finger domain-containing protein